MNRCVIRRHLLMLATVATVAAGWSGLPGAVAAPDAAVNLGSRHVLHSKILDEDRELLVYLPNGYGRQPDRRYPLFVVLDGRMNFKATAGMIHSLSEGGVIPRMVVVGVANTDRWRDLTPVAGMGIPGTGGGDAFLQFLHEELVPHLEETYRLNGFRTISGHSLGGLTVLNVWARAPHLFDAHIALSPSLEWGDGFLLERIRDSLKAHPTGERMLFLSIADEQLERPYYERLVALLERAAPQEVAWSSAVFEDRDDHMSIRVTGGLAGIRWVFADWRLTSAQIMARNDSQITRHYERASRRYDQTLRFDLMAMTNAAYWGLYQPATLDRALALFRRAVQQWPESAYAWSCLGEGLERTGDPTGALVHMERALAMARRNDDSDLAYYQGMVERVRRTLAAQPRPPAGTD